MSFPPSVTNLFRGIPFSHEDKIPEQVQESLAPFTRYRFHFISDWLRQSDMKISPVYTMPFSFHIALVSCHFQSVFI